MWKQLKLIFQIDSCHDLIYMLQLQKDIFILKMSQNPMELRCLQLSSGFSSVFSNRTADLKQRLGSGDIHKNPHMADVGEAAVESSSLGVGTWERQYQTPEATAAVFLPHFWSRELKKNPPCRLFRQTRHQMCSSVKTRRCQCLDYYQMYINDLSRSFMGFFSFHHQVHYIKLFSNITHSLCISLNSVVGFL